MGEILIYSGSFYKVVCRDGKHFQVYEDGAEEVNGHSLRCRDWMGPLGRGDCPGKWQLKFNQNRKRRNREQ